MRALLLDVRALLVILIVGLAGCASAYRPEASTTPSHVVVSGNVPVASGQASAKPFEILEPIEDRSESRSDAK